MIEQIESNQQPENVSPLLSAVKHIVVYEFTRRSLEKIDGPVPIAVQIRNTLNANGFKFKDDGKLSSVTNENPEPEGVLTRWEDYDTGSIFYKQELST